MPSTAKRKKNLREDFSLCFGNSSVPLSIWRGIRFREREEWVSPSQSIKGRDENTGRKGGSSPVFS